MADYAAVARTVQRVELDANAVLVQAWRLYRRLFARSLLLSGLIFGSLHIAEAFARSHGRNIGVGLLTIMLAVAGTALLQGGLVEIVRGLHLDGDDKASLGEVLARASGRTLKLIRASVLSALGIGVGLLLLVFPGLVLMTRWAVAVPVAMLEGGTARDALRRSKTIVAGNGWNVFQVIFAVSMLTAVITLPIGFLSAHTDVFGWWVAATISSMITAPFAAHALTVVYYALVEPERPVFLDRGHSWASVWDDDDSVM
jgi:hypothetical protein